MPKRLSQIHLVDDAPSQLSLCSHESRPRFAKHRAHLSEQALSRPVPKARLDLPLALGEEENQAMHVLCARALHFSHGVPEVSNTRLEEVESASNVSRFCRSLLVESAWRSPWRKKKQATPARKTHEKHVFEGSGATCKVQNTKALTIHSKYEIHAGENKVGCGAHRPPMPL